MTRATLATAVLAAALALAPGRSLAMDKGAMMPEQETAVLAGGCFWCMEAIYQQLDGVKSVVSGFAGGGTGPVTYAQVCSGNTGYAESVQVTFDPRVISYQELLTVFFAVHDPTTLNRQGADVGTQYRSAIFYDTPEQKRQAEEVIAELTKNHVFEKPIVTQIAPLDAFVVADSHHQDYYLENRNAPYCRAVIDPKLDKFRKKFHDRLKAHSGS